MDKLKIGVPVVALTGVAMTLGILSVDLPPWLAKMASDWGPAFLILAALMAGVVRYVPQGVVGDFVKAQQEQAVAMASISRSLQEISAQPTKLDEIKGLLEDALITQRVAIRKLDILEKRLAPHE